MKLLIYSRSFAPQIGGVETYAMLLAQGLAMLSSSPPVQVVLVTQTPRGAFHDGALPFTVVRRPGLIRLTSLIRHSDVIYLAGPVIGPLFLSILFRKPVVVGHHGYQANCPNGLLFYEPTKSSCPGHYMRQNYLECLRCNSGEAGWFTSFRWLMLTPPRRWLCARASVNLCVSEHVVLRVQLPHSMVIYHGVPAAPVVHSIEPPGRSQSASSRSLSVAYVGRLVHEKGVATLIRAAQLASEQGCSITLRVIGDGPERQSLEAMAVAGTNGSLSIQFTGSLQGDALHSALQGTAVAVIPSLNEEPAGLVVMEQMSAGRPVIVTNHGGSSEIAADAGLSFPPGDAVALAGCLCRLAGEPKLLADLGVRARKRAASLFTQERMIRQHYDLFAELGQGAAR
ncbi:MAG TPA: glycosyltransferase family 4 protein [Candidatus Acidoferrum sp.]|nr:glycosyltransferase family 4 protein [Candidatus Acidoferrum sp.]